MNESAFYPPHFAAAQPPPRGTCPRLVLPKIAEDCAALLATPNQWFSTNEKPSGTGRLSVTRLHVLCVVLLQRQAFPGKPG